MHKGVEVGQGLTESPCQGPSYVEVGTAALRSSLPQPLPLSLMHGIPVPVPVPPLVVVPPSWVPLAFETPQGVMQVEGRGDVQSNGSSA